MNRTPTYEENHDAKDHDEWQEGARELESRTVGNGIVAPYADLMTNARRSSMTQSQVCGSGSRQVGELHSRHYLSTNMKKK